MDPWIAEHAAAIAAHAERELEALVAISTPSGDVHGAEEAVALVAALAPNEATIERVPCSSPDHAPDLVLRLTGSGSRRLLLLGHLDTVVAHDEHRALSREGEQLAGLGRDRHEGRRRARARRPARPRHARRCLRGGRAAARVRRGVARRALRPRPALRRLRRLPVLRGRPAGRRRPRGRRRPPQGGRHPERDRARAQRALGLGARTRGSTRCWPWPRRRRPSRAARTRTGPSG